MATLDVETSYSVYKNCMLRLGRYMSDSSLAVEIYNMQDGAIARVTACLSDPTLGENESYVDTNNCPWATSFLESNGLAKRTGKTRRSGYCIYPEMEFDREKIAKFEMEI